MSGAEHTTLTIHFLNGTSAPLSALIGHKAEATRAVILILHDRGLTLSKLREDVAQALVVDVPRDPANIHLELHVGQGVQESEHTER